MFGSQREPALSDEAVKRIVGFLGYGNVSARVWFIGHEEGLGRASHDEAIINLVARGHFQPIMDLVRAHHFLRENGQSIEIETKKSFTQVWTWMAKLMRARAGEADWRDKEGAKAYVRQRLGRRTGETFLTELSPIPRRTQKDNSWMDWFQTRKRDLNPLLEKRQKALRVLFYRHAPSLVVCYGSGAKCQFQELFSLGAWERTNELREASSDRHILMLPFFGNGHMKHAVIETLLAKRLLQPNSIS
jgi:hypothetical protein